MAKQIILVIEDEPAIRQILHWILEGEGFDVRLAAAGEEGLQQAREIFPDLVLLDLNLSLADGLEVCRRLRHSGSTRQVPILFLTGTGDEGEIQAGLSAGANAYLSKPFNHAELMISVRWVLSDASTMARSSTGMD